MDTESVLTSDISSEELEAIIEPMIVKEYQKFIAKYPKRDSVADVLYAHIKDCNDSNWETRYKFIEMDERIKRLENCCEQFRELIDTAQKMFASTKIN